VNEHQRNLAVARVQKAQAEFLACLEKLTLKKKARWLRSGSQPGLILCRIGDEMLIFEASNGGPSPVDLGGEVGGVVCKFRNHTWLWLTALEEGQKMLGLLRKAKIDEQEFVRWRVNTYRSGVEFLKSALNKKTG
jgi:hypothetical protein